jgi:hypothetical protein
VDFAEVEEQCHEQCAELGVLEVGEVAQRAQGFHGAFQGVHVALFGDEAACRGAAAFRRVDDFGVGTVCAELLKVERYVYQCHILWCFGSLVRGVGIQRRSASSLLFLPR